MTFFDTEHIFGAGNLTIAFFVGIFLVYWFDYLTKKLEKTNSRSIRVISKYTFYFGFALGIYLILGGVSTFDGWGDRIAEGHKVMNEGEGRGRGIFLLLSYGSPVLLILFGWATTQLSKYLKLNLEKEPKVPRKEYPY